MKNLPIEELNQLFFSADKQKKELSIKQAIKKGYNKAEAEYYYNCWKREFLKEHTRGEEKQIEKIIDAFKGDVATKEEVKINSSIIKAIKEPQKTLTVKIEGMFFSYEKGKKSCKVGNTTYALSDLKGIINELVEAGKIIKNLQG